MHALLVVLLLTGPLVPPAGSAPRQCTRDDVSVRLRLDRLRYDADQPVRMTMTVKNVSERRCTMQWSDGKRASLTVHRKDGRRVWLHHACMGYTQAIVEEEWDRGHTERYRGRWRQHTSGDPDTCKSDGGLARAGRYFARGVFEGAGGVRSNRVWFRLRR